MGNFMQKWEILDYTPKNSTTQIIISAQGEESNQMMLSMETWRKKASNKEFAKPEEQLITIDSKEMRRSYSKMENFYIVLQRPELNLETEVIGSHFMNVKWNRPCCSRR